MSAATSDLTTTPYELLGGDEQAVRRIVDRFYDLMESAPEARELRAMHAPDLGPMRDRLTWFLSGWLGGPSLYIERFGHPRLRARHLPFPIGEAERDAWLACMRDALRDREIDAALSEWLMSQLFGTADWMRNKAG